MSILYPTNKIQNKHKKTKGFSLVEVMIASALMLLVFSGLFAGMHLMIQIITHSKAEAGARSLAVERIEYIRSLPYDSVGTIAGIPEGPIAQTASTTLNGVAYDIRTLIQYIDREEDGFGADDENGVTEDSKQVKVTYSWTIQGEAKSYTVVTDIAPNGIESTSGGGTLFINVFDADVQPVLGADVHVFNDTGTSTIDVTVTTNASGIANFPGAPEGGGYQITVTKDGYSTDQTYSASDTNPNPNPPHVAVVAGTVSTVYLSIDELSDLTIRAISTPITGVFSDTFSSTGQLANYASTTVSSGELVLADNAGTYVEEGFAYATATSPSLITSWEAFSLNGTSTEDTAYRVHLYSVSGSSYTLVSDEDLPENSTGFTNGTIDISELDVATYPALALGVSMETNDAAQTPALYDWSLSYIESETPIGDVTFAIQGSKTIGNNAGVPVYKYTNTATTDGSGEVLVSDLEWDAYSITIDGSTEGYDISETYEPVPFALNPGISDTLTFVLQTHTTYSLRTTVTDTLGSPVVDAQVRLYNGSFDETFQTSINGQVFFNEGLSSGSNYTLSVSKDGYQTDTQTNFSITGNMETSVVLGLGGEEEETSTTTESISTYLAGYNARIPLSISGTSLFGDVSDFPVYVDLSDLPASFFASVQSDGDDIRVTKADGLSEVPFELVTINTGSKTGELHFKAPSLLTATTSTFYIYYGSSTASSYATTDTYGRNNVWSNGFLAVYHLEETQSGKGNNDLYIDATGQGGDGDDYISATGKLGKLGRGQEFNNAYTDRIALPYTILDNKTNVTLSFWYRTNTNDYMSVLSGAKNNSSNGANEYLLWFQDLNDMQFFSHGEPRVNFDIANINDNVWRHYVSVRDDSNNRTRLYINANEDNESPENDSMSKLNIAPGGLFIGVDQDSVGGSFDQELDGELDEFRIANTIRSSDWISNVYLNQNSPTGFYSVGSVEIE